MFLVIEACLERAVQSQSAQSSELWTGWRVVRGCSLRMIIRCFYGELPNFTMTSAKGKALNFFGVSSTLVVTLINSHDQSFWWMGHNLNLTTGWVWGRGGGTWDGGCWGESRTGVKWTVLLHCESTLFLSVGNLSPHVLVCVFFFFFCVHAMPSVFEYQPSGFLFIFR